MPGIVQALKRECHELSVDSENNYMAWSRSEKRWFVRRKSDGQLLAIDKDQKTAVDYLLGKR